MQLRNIIVAVVVVVAATVTLGRCYQGSVSEWENRVSQVQGLVEAERERRQAAEERVRQLKEDAAQDSARADSLVQELESDSAEVRERIVRVREETPDSLRNHPAILARDSIIVDLREGIAGWRHAFRVERRRANTLSRALEVTESSLTSAEASVDSLMAVLDDRPGPRPWYLPEIGVGPFAGVDTEGSFAVGPVAVTLTWSVSP